MSKLGWAVGEQGGDPGPVPFALRFDGERWRRVRTDPDVVGRALGVGGSRAGAVWLVGQLGHPDSPRGPLAERWNGTEWRQTLPAPPERSRRSDLYAVDNVAGHTWAVGLYRSRVTDQDEPLAYHRSCA